MDAPAIAVTAALIVLYVAACVWVYRGECARPLDRDRIIREARARTGLIPPAPDNQPGSNHADADECALIYSLPAYDPAWETGLERLRDAIRDEQNGDTP